MINATEARKITFENLSGPVIKPILERIGTKIMEAAMRGQSSLILDYRLWMVRTPDFDERQAVFAHLTTLGFGIRHHDDPDPGHPCSRGDYYTVSW